MQQGEIKPSEGIENSPAFPSLTSVLKGSCGITTVSNILIMDTPFGSPGDCPGAILWQ